MIFFIISQYSFFISAYLLGSLFVDLQFIPSVLAEYRENRTIIVVAVSLALALINYVFLRKKEESGFFEKLSEKHQNREFNIPMWIIFSIPIIVIFVSIFIYGSFTGTLRFPLFEKMLNIQ